MVAIVQFCSPTPAIEASKQPLEPIMAPLEQMVINLRKQI
uniref:Uncharacterized protein n=1 Tax=Arundo donax TaxID=35708 RepID=A0A0A9QMG4_ARUDO